MQVSNLNTYTQTASSKTGPLASTGVDGLAFMSTKMVQHHKMKVPLDWPDIEMHMVPADVVADNGRYFRQLAGLKEEVSFIHIKL